MSSNKRQITDVSLLNSKINSLSLSVCVPRPVSSLCNSAPGSGPSSPNSSNTAIANGNTGSVPNIQSEVYIQPHIHLISKYYNIIFTDSCSICITWSRCNVFIVNLRAAKHSVIGALCTCCWSVISRNQPAYINVANEARKCWLTSIIIYSSMLRLAFIWGFKSEVECKHEVGNSWTILVTSRCVW